MKTSRREPSDEAERRLRLEPRSVAVEAGIVVLLGAVLASVSIGLLFLQYGDRYGEYLRFGLGDVVTAGAAGVTAAAVIRLTVRLHRRWKKTIGRFTASAALCALAGVAGALVALVPGECPGGLFATGRCGVREAAAWGQVAGLLALVNFGIAGISLAFWRFTRALVREGREVIRDGSAQGVTWVKALRDAWRRRRARGRAADGANRGPQDPKGRPTPRRADAERARRKRLRARA